MADLVSLTLGTSALAADLLQLITYLEFVESLDELDALLVRFDVPTGPLAETLLGAVKVGTTFTVKLQFDATTAFEGKGDVVDVSYTWRRSGYWEVQVRGLEPLHRARATRAPTLHTGAPASFLSAVASTYSLSANAQGVDGNAPVTLQAVQTDADLLRTLAEDFNYAVSAVDGKLGFARRNVGVGATTEIDFVTDVDDIRMDVSVHGVLSKVTVLAEDYTKSTPEVIKGVADSAKLKKISGGDDAIKLSSTFGTREMTVPRPDAVVQSYADALATGMLQRAAEKLVRGTARCGPLSAPRSGGLVKFTNAPWPLTGPFLVRQTRRVVEGRDLRTEIEFFSDSLPVAT